MTLTWETMRSVAGMTDDVGVLSVYLTLDPYWRGEATATAPWELHLRHELDRVRDEAKQHLSREHYQALTARLERLGPDLDRLRDPTAPGQGRALFAGVASGEVQTVSLQVPLADRVVLNDRPQLRPLLAAWSNAGPAGVVAVSADEVRVVDLRFGRTDELAVLRYVAPPEQRRLEGPAAANPALSQHSAPQRDLFESREDDKLRRYLRTIGDRIAGHATEQGWEHLVVTGERQLVQAVTEGLPPPWSDQAIVMPHPVTGRTRPRLAATVEPELTAARRRHHHALASRAYQAAMAANAGAWGLGETLDSLQQGRVAHLLLSADGHWTGSRTPDGLLVPDGEVPPGVDAAALTPEPELGERMIELAFRGSAQVTVMDPDEAAPLADAGGVGALLRW